MNLLRGVRVLEYASLVSGPYCGKLLADLGAEVIKIEPPGTGDIARRRGPFPHDDPDPGSSLLFEYVNVNKKGITLDITVRSGQEIFRRLATSVDLLIEDTPPGLLSSMGLDCASLRSVNSRLAVVSITSFGQDGPHRNWKAYNLNTTHIGGEGWLTPSGLAQRTFPDREPLKAGGHIGDYYCGVTAAVAAILGIIVQSRSGQGQHIDMSKQEAHATLVRVAIGLWANQGILETRVTRDNLYGGCLRCKDGYFEIIMLQEDHWAAFVEMAGRPAWALDSRFKDHASRGQHGAEVTERIAEWARERTKEEVYQLGRRYGVPIGLFYSPLEVLGSQHEQERGFFTPVVHPRIPELSRVPSVPFRFSHQTYAVKRAAPRVGEHNAEVYEHLLGYSREETVKLYQAGVI